MITVQFWAGLIVGFYTGLALGLTIMAVTRSRQCYECKCQVLARIQHIAPTERRGAVIHDFLWR